MGKRVRGLVAVVAAAGLIVGNAGIAWAYPVTGISLSSTQGKTSGSATWYNRSVGLQGSVTDYVGGDSYTQVVCVAHAPGGDQVTTRTASSGTTPFNFIFDFSTYVPGADTVFYFLCNPTSCYQDSVTYRP